MTMNEGMRTRGPPLINRRQFLSFLGGAALTASVGHHFENKTLPAIHQEVSAPGEKIAILYDQKPHENVGAVLNASTAFIGGVAGASLTNPLRTQEYTQEELQRHSVLELEKKEKLRQIKKGLTKLLLLSLGVDMERGVIGLTRESKSVSLLAEDLRKKGFNVVHTGSSQKFIDALEAAKENRPKHAKTLVVINAHGGYDITETGFKNGVVVPTRFDTSIQTEGKWMIPLSSIADIVKDVPGHTLIAAKTCHLSPHPFEDIKNAKGHVTLLTSNNANPGVVSLYALPLMESMRHALRKKGDFIKNTNTAQKQLFASYTTKIAAWLHKSGIKTVRIGGHNERFEA